MRPDVQQVIEEQYRRARDYQTLRGIQFNMTLDEFTTLWSSYRINKLQSLLDRGPRFVERYLRDQIYRPVCSWTAREERSTGVMHKGNARITAAQDSRRMFQTKKGDKLRPDTIAKMSKPKTDKHKANMCKPKSDETRRKMAAARAAYWARVRAEKEKM